MILKKLENYIKALRSVITSFGGEINGSVKYFDGQASQEEELEKEIHDLNNDIRMLEKKLTTEEVENISYEKFKMALA